MAKVVLSIITDKYTLIYILAALGAIHIGYAIRECCRKCKKENLYLLSVRLMNAAERCRTFDELDAVKAEFFDSFRSYGSHEDFKDCQTEVRAAISKKTDELHNLNFPCSQ